MKNRHRADQSISKADLIIAPKEPIDEGLRFTSDVVAQLAGNGVDIRALTRTPEKARSPCRHRPPSGIESCMADRSSGGIA
jgi:hypothetical protein